MTVLLVQAASEFDRNMCGFYLLIFYKMFHCIKKGETFDIKQISFGSILLYSSEHFTSKKPNSPSTTTLPSRVAPRTKLFLSMTNPQGSPTTS